MPAALMRACSGRPGCPALVTAGACEDCKRARQTAYDDRRGTAASRGYTAQWAAYSRWARSTVLLYCGDRMPGAPETDDSVCKREGRVTQLAHGGGVVDHIEPVQGKDDPRFWDRTNHQGLCNECHNAKRQRESMVAKGAA
jgi:5-methylcytosine-specific restriction enzyme A